MPESLRERLSPRVERLGYLGEFFQVAAHQPGALSHFIDFTESLKGAIDWRLTETIALTVASHTENRYEQVQHEHLAIRWGMSTAEVKALVDHEVKESGLFEIDEELAASLAEDVVAGQGRSCAESFQALTAVVGDDVAVGCLMIATRYLAHATMSNTWGVAAPVDSPLEGVGGR
jgi:hypothetical protein